MEAPLCCMHLQEISRPFVCGISNAVTGRPRSLRRSVEHPPDKATPVLPAWALQHATAACAFCPVHSTDEFKNRRGRRVYGICMS